MKTGIIFTLLFLSVSNSIKAEIKAPECLLCGIPHALIATDQTSTSATLSWGVVSGATQYTVEVQDFQVTPITPSAFQVVSIVGSNSYVVTGLQTGVTYKFKVSANCGGEDGMWSEWRLFNPVAGTDSTCLAPVILASNMTGSTARLSWSNQIGAAHYYLEVEDEQNGTSNFQLAVAPIDSFYNMTELQAGILYKFRVSAECSSGQSSWSNWQYFNGNTDSIGVGSVGCNKPIGLQALGMSYHSAELSWYPSPGALNYIIEVAYFMPGATPWQITQVVTSNNYHLTGLSANTRYKYKVRSNCISGGNSAWSNWRKFQTPLFTITTTPGENQTIGTGDRSSSPMEHSPVFGIQVWPNPVQTTAVIQLQNMSTASAATIRLYDLSGHPVMERHFQPEKDAWEAVLSFQDLPDGMYLLQIHNGANINSTKLVVQH